MTKSEENENRIIAERYANAVMELADNEADQEDILAQISDINTSISNSDDLKKIIFSPVVSSKEKKDVITNIFSTTTSGVVINFLKLLVDKNRFDIFSSIVKEYRAKINERKGVLSLKVTSAIELNENEKAMVKVKLQKVLDKEIELDFGVNNDIIGGLIFEVNDKVIDCSLLKRLQTIKKEILN